MRESKKRSVLKLCLLTMSQVMIVTFSGDVAFAGRGSAIFEEGLRIGAHFIKSSRRMHADFPRLGHTSGLSNEYRKRFTKQPMVAPIVPEAYSSDNRERYRYGQHINFPLFNATQAVFFPRLGHTSRFYNEFHKRFSTQSTLAREVYSSDNRERYRYDQYTHGQHINFPFFTAALAVLAASPQGDSDENKGQDQKKSSRVDDGTADTTDGSVSSSSDSSNWREKLKKLETRLLEERLTNEEKVKLLSEAVSLINNNISLDEKNYENVILFLGRTKTGKSTLISYLANAEIWWEWDAKDNEFVLKFNNVPDGIEIGPQNFTSCTSVPVPYLYGGAETTMFDCPGFEDSHGLFHRIINAKLTQGVLKRTKKANFVLTIPEAYLENGGFIKLLTDSIKQLNSYIEDLDKAKEGILLVITQGASGKNDAAEWAGGRIQSILDEAMLTLEQKSLLRSIKDKENFAYTFRKKIGGPKQNKEYVSITERDDIIQCLQKLPSINRDSLSFQKTVLSTDSEREIDKFSKAVNEYIQARIKKIGDIIHNSFNERLKEVSKDYASRKEFEEFYVLSKNFNESLGAIFHSSPEEFDQFCEILNTEIIQKSSNPSSTNLSNILSEIEKTKDILVLFQEVAPNTYSFSHYIESIRQLQATHMKISKKLNDVSDRISKEDEGLLGAGVGILSGTGIVGSGIIIVTYLAGAATAPTATVGLLIGAVGGYLLKDGISGYFKKKYWWPYHNIGKGEKK